MRSALTRMASPRLTVVLLAAAMFIVFAGTLAQAEMDVWQVVDAYFRIRFDSWDSFWSSCFARIELGVFLPRSFFPGRGDVPGAIYFPSGWLVGFGLALNLAAAFVTRFAPTAEGAPRRRGWALLAAGVVLAALVIAFRGGAGPEDPAWRIVWLLAQGGAAAGLCLWGCVLLHGKRAGLVLLHAGIAVLMVGELFVGTSAEEGVMFLREGQTSNLIADPRAPSVRVERPYSVTLLDVRKVDYPGTNVPSDYSSFVRISDPERGTREVRIWMNNPLRFAGDTLYQSGYHQDHLGEATTLQVVSNEARMVPYLGCMVVALGMLAHFGIALVRWSRRRRAAAPVAPRLWWPAVLALGAALWLGWAYRSAEPYTAAERFGEVPVLYQGRIKPLDTLARNSLRIVSDRYSFVDPSGREQPAMRWLLDVVARPEVGFAHRVVRIDNDRVQELMGLMPREGMRYSLDELRPRVGALIDEAKRAAGLDPSQLDSFDRKVLELHRKLGLVHMLIAALTPPEIRPDHLEEDVQAAWTRLGLLLRDNPPLVVPPEGDGDWQLFGSAWLNATARGEQLDLSAAFAAHAAGDEREMDRRVAALRARGTPGATTTSFEARFNRFEPYTKAAALYLLAFVLTALSWMLSWSRWRDPLRQTAWWLGTVTLALHSFALIARMYIHGRPMVTNLYSSAIFIGWAGALIGLWLERINRNGIGNTVSSVAGYATLIIAHNLAGDGDTLAVMQAVLDTNFWLATHVTCITLGYATTFVAGTLGCLYVLAGVARLVLRTETSPGLEKLLCRMIYGVTCFALLFSFVGTVLGGLWADDSWGRFWGWDPKENGALLVVLWNALALHARWSKMVSQRGIALVAIGGNACVAWSWFGVNELGVGLHSYGFTEGVLHKLGIFVLSQLLLIAVGAAPLERWRATLATRASHA